MVQPSQAHLESDERYARRVAAPTTRSGQFQLLLDRMRYVQPSRALDCEVHDLIGGRRFFAIGVPRYSSDFEAAYSLLRTADVTMLSLEGGWEPYCPEAHPAWAVQYYTRERPPTEGNKGGWHGAIAAGVAPAIALCRAALVVLARSQGLTVRAE